MSMNPRMEELGYHRLSEMVAVALRRPDNVSDPPYAALLLMLSSGQPVTNGIGLIERLEINEATDKVCWSNLQSLNERVWCARATTHSQKNHLRHAEMKVMEMAHRELYDAVFGALPKLDNETSVDGRPQFFIFVNALSCPMCMTAIIKSQVRNIYFFGSAETVGKPPGPLPAQLARLTNDEYGAERFTVEQIGTLEQRDQLKSQITQWKP